MLDHISPRRARLVAEFETLTALSKASSVFTFTTPGEPYDRYTFVFRGRSLGADEKDPTWIITRDEQRCDVRIPLAYPIEPPDCCWITPVWHPNIGLGGVVRLEEIGLPSWNPNAGLEVVAECLWDVARLAFADIERAINIPARDWLLSQKDLLLPIDPRPLRNVVMGPNRNVVKYDRRGGTAANPAERELFFIGEDAPSPAPSNGSGIWFLGEE